MNMRPAWWLTVPAAVAALAMPGAALACSCAQPETAQAFEQSSAVFAGTVTEVNKPFWDRIGLSNSGSHDVTFQVTKRWKGAESATETVRTRLTGEACGYPFKIGGAYLVFVAPGPIEDLETGICSGTRELSESDADIATLNRLAAGEAAP
jgi:hypothetical protein